MSPFCTSLLIKLNTRRADKCEVVHATAWHSLETSFRLEPGITPTHGVDGQGFIQLEVRRSIHLHRTRALANASGQPKEIAGEHQALIIPGQTECPHLRQFHSWMQPGPVTAEQHLPRSCPLGSLFQYVKSAHSRSISIDIRMSDEVIDKCDLRPPVIGEATKMRNDEIHIGIFLCEEFAHRDLSHDVVEH